MPAAGDAFTVSGGVEVPVPALERSEHSAHDWFTLGGPDRRRENHAHGELLIHDLIARALRDHRAGR
ncbi:hypothetical protein OG782_30005 [Streptomyces sp. NBC_00876]|uniref:hypothetical protein n=1 Tax=Streptomyces sp. NBC_00876 TaxID=2975853 RepID=UPI0038685BC3|nr:hypothetical protein OG782_30005 [Streptomyces sp. NBC_00876]